MADVILSQDALKQAMKDAFTEVIAERQGELRAVVADILEDLLFGEALREAEETAPVERERIFDLLDGAS